MVCFERMTRFTSAKKKAYRRTYYVHNREKALKTKKANYEAHAGCRTDSEKVRYKTDSKNILCARRKYCILQCERKKTTKRMRYLAQANKKRKMKQAQYKADPDKKERQNKNGINPNLTKRKRQCRPGMLLVPLRSSRP